MFTQPDLNLRQQRWLETIADFNMDISYTPRKANVMADALSHKAYCSELEVQLQQPLLYEELRKLNLEIVPQGEVNNLVLEPKLDHCIKMMQGYDPFIRKMKHELAAGRAAYFTVDNKGTLSFRNCLVVPRGKENLNETVPVMQEAHDTPLSIHLGSTKMYQDIR